MTALLLLLVALVWGQEPPSEVELAWQQTRVTQLAWVAAEARDSGSPRAEVASAMKAYRAEAEVLVAMQESARKATLDADMVARASAVSSLEEALARGRPVATARATIADWLGELTSQLQVLGDALTAVRSRPDDPLSHDLALDVAERARVVWLAASYDASRARAEARELRLRAHTLRSRSTSGMSGGMDDALAAKGLDEDAEKLDATAIESQELATKAEAIEGQAMTLAGEEP